MKHNVNSKKRKYERWNSHMKKKQRRKNKNKKQSKTNEGRFGKKNQNERKKERKKEEGRTTYQISNMLLKRNSRARGLNNSGFCAIGSERDREREGGKIGAEEEEQ